MITERKSGWAHRKRQPPFETPALAVLPPRVGFPLGLVAISGNQGRIRLLASSDGSEQTVLAGYGSWVSDLVFGTDGRLHSVGMNDTARTWDTTESGPDRRCPRPAAHRLIPHRYFCRWPPARGSIRHRDFDMIDVDTGAVHSLAGQSLHISNGAAVSPGLEIRCDPSVGRWARLGA